MTVSKTTASKWMKYDGSGPASPGKVIATARGWERQMASGQTELLHAIGGLAHDMTSIAMVLIQNPAAGNYEHNNAITGTPATMDFLVSWLEAVVITGAPRLEVFVDDGGAGATVYADYVEMVDANTARFTLDTSDTAVDGTIEVMSLELNGGTIKDAETNNAVLTFPTDYDTTPDGVDIITIAPSIVSIESPVAGNYSQGTSDPLSWVVTFSEPVTVAAVDGGLLVADGIGNETIPYASGSGTTELTFTQTADNMGLGEVDTVRNPALSLGTGGNEYTDADGNYALTARPADYVRTDGIIIVA